ncbi:MAG: hypothetical protein WA816_04235 [Bacteroidales bacterium]
MNYKNFFTLSMILLVLSPLSAQNDSETRSFLKIVPVGKETTLEVSNKYGTIQVTTWNKDSAYIKAEVKAFAKDRSKLGKMFDGITVNISDTKYLVRAQTEFTSNINTLFESFKGMTSKIISYDSHIEINYFINIPEYLNLKIENKYGDVYMENNTGEFNISISNGSFKANSLGKKTSIKMVFCDAKINSIESGNIDASFSDLSIGETGDLSINSISSKYDIKKADMISGESRRDKFFIENIVSLQGNAYFTDYKMNNVRKEINLTTRYGSVDASVIAKVFESVNINSGYSDLTLSFEPGSSYNLDIKHSNSFLVLPDRNIKTEQKVLNEDKKEYIISGTFGKSPGTAKVKIDATRGNIYIK